MIDILLFALIGVAIGTVTALIPGLHVNTVIPLILSLTFVSNPYVLAVLIISIAVTQIFVGFIPSIFLGAPDEDTALSVLPGHKILFEGRGYEAIRLTVVGGLISIFVTIAIIFVFSNYYQTFYHMIRPYMHFILLAVVLLMIFSERKMKKILFAGLIIVLSGLLGFFVLNSPIIDKQNSLLPIFSGLFGVSALLVSISEKSTIPDQSYDPKFNVSFKKILLSAVLGSVAGILVGFLPAIGVSQAAASMQYIGGINQPRTFLTTLSGINVANEIFSLNSLYLVGNPRSGASVAIEKILGEVSFSDILLFTGVITFVSGISAFLAIQLGKRIPKILIKINYRKLSTCIIIFISSMVFLLTGLNGLLVLATSTSMGFLCIRLGVKRSTLMGVLLLPTISFFAGLTPSIILVLGL